MPSQFDSFDESPCHERIGSAFGGFGGGGGLPEPGNCLLVFAGPFGYDWDTGRELVFNEDNNALHTFAFDKDMVLVHRDTDYTYTEMLEGYSEPAAFKGGAGVYWARGHFIAPDGSGGHKNGYVYDSVGRRTQRFELTRYRLYGIGPPSEWWPQGFIMGPRGSGNIGNLEGFAFEGFQRRDGDPWQYRYGLARYADGRPVFSDAIEGLPPQGTFSNEDGNGNETKSFDGEDGVFVRLSDAYVHRIPVSRNPFAFHLDLEQKADVFVPFIPDGIWDDAVYNNFQFYSVGHDGATSMGVFAAGKDYYYLLATIDRRDGRFPQRRMCIARFFVDWTLPGIVRPVMTHLGMSDVGTDLNHWWGDGGIAGWIGGD